MDSIRVYINDTEVGVYSIAETGVTYTWQAKLIDEINSFSTVTNKTVTLPLTNALETILKSPSVIDTTNSLSNREYWRIKVKWNDTVSIDGYIKLQRTVILENDKYIEFGIEPKEKDWVTEFKDFTLPQLDYTISPSQEHQLTYANVITSETYLPLTREYVYAPIDIAEVGRLQVIWVEQDIPYTGTTRYYYLGEPVVAGSGTFVGTAYGFDNTGLTVIDKTFTDVPNAFWNGRGVYIAQIGTILETEFQGQTGYIFSLGVDYWQVSDLYPSIRHNAVIQRCFNRVGYNVTIVDSSEYFNDKYNFVHNVEQLNKFESERNKLKVRVQAGGFSFSHSSNHDWIVPFLNLNDTGLIPNVIKFDDTDSDNSGLIDTLSNYSRYTVNEDCVLGFKWNYKVRYTMTNPFTFPLNYDIIELRIKQYDSGGTVRRTVEFILESDTTMTTLSWYFEGALDAMFYMESGDYVECYIGANIGGGQAPVTVEILDTNSFETIYYKGGNYTNKTIRLNEYLPDRTAYDYIKDLSFINNWEFYTNESLKHVYIVREDNKRSGEQIDFKDKLNRSDAVELEEVGLQWAKKIYFNWLKDDNDWCVKVVENNMRQGLGDTYDKNEMDVIARFGYGVINNLNLFAEEFTEYSNNIYAASLDKFEQNNQIKFNTIEMKGEETWGHIPTWKRVDYEPRYLTIYFGETVETNGIGGATNTIVYSIDGNATHTTYPRAEFGEALHYGDATGLLTTKYAKRARAIRYGWILRGFFTINENDVNTFVEVYEDNKFRGDYALQVNGVKQIGELLKVNDFSPLSFNKTEIEFIIYRDDY